MPVVSSVRSSISRYSVTPEAVLNGFADFSGGQREQSGLRSHGFVRNGHPVERPVRDLLGGIFFGQDGPIRVRLSFREQFLGDFGNLGQQGKGDIVDSVFRAFAIVFLVFVIPGLQGFFLGLYGRGHRGQFHRQLGVVGLQFVFHGLVQHPSRRGRHHREIDLLRNAAFHVGIEAVPINVVPLDPAVPGRADEFPVLRLETGPFFHLRDGQFVLDVETAGVVLQAQVRPVDQLVPDPVGRAVLNQVFVGGPLAPRGILLFEDGIERAAEVGNPYHFRADLAQYIVCLGRTRAFAAGYGPHAKGYADEDQNEHHEETLVMAHVIHQEPHTMTPCSCSARLQDHRFEKRTATRE